MLKSNVIRVNLTIDSIITIHTLFVLFLFLSVPGANIACLSVSLQRARCESTVSMKLCSQESAVKGKAEGTTKIEGSLEKY